jgi:hypothetical protein
MYLWYIEKIWRKSAIPDTKKSVGNEFVSARLGRVGQKYRLLAVGPTCRRHVGDFPSQGFKPLLGESVSYVRRILLYLFYSYVESHLNNDRG